MRLDFSSSSSACIRSVASSRSSSPSLLNTLTSSEGPRSSPPPPPLEDAADPLEVEAAAGATAGGDADAAEVELVDGAVAPRGETPPAEAVAVGPMPAAAAGGVAVTAAGILEGGILSLFAASIFTRSFPRHHLYVSAILFRDFFGQERPAALHAHNVEVVLFRLTLVSLCFDIS